MFLGLSDLPAAVLWSSGGVAKPGAGGCRTLSSVHLSPAFLAFPREQWDVAVPMASRSSVGQDKKGGLAVLGLTSPAGFGWEVMHRWVCYK